MLIENKWHKTRRQSSRYLLNNVMKRGIFYSKILLIIIDALKNDRFIKYS